ncbi:MAG: N5-carboxyaminoimidazole ribonucleotide synthase [Candidatus Omnitrophica bacterium]|nr:N5-carboxyaminoimidazole ribonucleotide synthase [Candidatus Omnitrophota bacterium]
MNPFRKSSYRLGIVKGGQLGKMMLQALSDWNVRTAVMDPDPDAPCRTLCDTFVLGDPLDAEALYRFGRGLDALTLEFENVNVEALERLAKEGVRVCPPPAALRIVQDKGLQKLFYAERGIPTSPFALVDGRREASGHTGLYPAFLKKRRSGYDGRGVMRLEDPAEALSRGFEGPCVLEKAADYRAEISVIVARTASGQKACFPPVELEFHPTKHLVEFLLAPARLEEAVLSRARELAERLSDELEIVGLLAVEMFVMKDGAVWVNEIAPRPHNSGHHTIEANRTSQFAQHLRAVLDLPLGPAEALLPAVMVNLLGEEGHEGEARYTGLEEALALPGVYPHLYGKRYTAPFRKMGHITITDTDLSRARRVAGLVRDKVRVLA